MATAKRLYLYGVSGVGLMLALSGAAVMLRTLFMDVGFGPADHTADTSKALFAMGLGLLVAGLIVWLIHWTIVERMVAAPKDDAAIAERRSIVRSVYFAGVLGVTLYIGASQVAAWLGRIVADMFKAKALAPDGGSITNMVDTLGQLGGGGIGGATVALGAFGAADDSWALAIVAVAAAAWGYHAWIRDRDFRQTSLISGAAAWVSRTYLYGATLVSLIVALDFIVHIARVIVGQWANVPAVGVLDKASGMGSVPVSADWVRPVIVSVAAVAVWGAVWAGHWLYSVRLRTGSGQQASAERGSKTRLGFMALVIFWAAATVVLFVGQSIGNILGLLVGVKFDPVPVWYVVLVPVIAAVPAAVAGWWHREQALAEDAAGGVPNVSADRVILYTIAVVGIAALTSGAADFLRSLLLQIFTNAGENAWKLPISAALGLAIAGAIAWGWAWMMAQARRLAAWQAEATSSSRSYYMYLVLGVAVAAGAMALNVIVEQYGAIILSLKNPALASDVSPSIATAVVAAVVIAYHYWEMGRDKVQPAPKPVAAAAPAASARPTATSRAAAPARKPAAKAPAKKPAAKKPAAKKPAR
jgi:hypothetical protein